MKTLAQPSSLSSLYHGDTDRNTNILLPYPSSIGKFPNTKFTIHDGSTPKNKVSHKTLAKKEAWRNAALLGDGIPGITTETPPKQLVQYWKDQFGFSYENLLTLSPGTVCDEINQGEAKMITLYPYDHIDAEKHAVEPQNHHKILSKKALLEMGIPTPETKVVSIPQTGINTIKWPLPIPFVIKTTHGLSGDGTYIIKTPKDLEKTKQTLHEYHTNYKLDQILCQKLVENEKVNYCVQAYVSKDGTIKPLGFTQQGTDQEGNFVGGIANYQEWEIEYKKFTKIMEQAGKYAHENGYFGVIGIDILEDDNDNLWVIDGNIRINGTTPLHLMRPLLTPSGIAIAKFSTEWAFQGTLDETLSNLFSEISKQRFIILSAVESKEKTEIYGVSTGKNTKDQEQNEKQLAKKGLTITT